MQCFDYDILPQWIRNSSFIKLQDKAEPIYLLEELIIPDILTSESFSIVFRSVRYFDSYPSNFWDYIKSINIEEINRFKETQLDSELEFINLLLEFKTLNKNNYLCNWAVNKRNLNCLKYAHKK